MVNWIRDPSDKIQYDMIKNEFSFDKTVPEVSIQSPQPLTRGKDMIKNEFSFDKTVPEVSIQSPQPLTRGMT